MNRKLNGEPRLWHSLVTLIKVVHIHNSQHQQISVIFHSMGAENSVPITKDERLAEDRTLSKPGEQSLKYPFFESQVQSLCNAFVVLALIHVSYVIPASSEV